MAEKAAALASGRHSLAEEYWKGDVAGGACRWNR